MDTLTAGLQLDYERCARKLASPEDWLDDRVAQGAFAALAGALSELGPRPRVAVYGSSWSGYAAVRMLREAAAAQGVEDIEVACILDAALPLAELAHIPHARPGIDPLPDGIDCVLLATSPRHYPHIRKTLADCGLNAPVCPMYRETPVRNEIPQPDMLLGVHTRLDTNSGFTHIPLSRRNLALILVDIWDSGQETCPFCESVPRLLELARRHDLLTIHAPSYEVDDQGRFVHRRLARPAIADITWPPPDFRCKEGPFAFRNLGHLQFQESPRNIPEGIHGCALPQPRAKEFVASELDEVLGLLEDHRTLYVLYAGGGTAQCLIFKPAGYHNLAQRGYQPILVRDATYNAPVEVQGQSIDMTTAGIVCFEWLCQFSTTVKMLEEALGSTSGRNAH